MKRFVLLFCTLCIAISSFCQSWTPFVFDAHYYISKSEVVTPSPIISFSSGEIINLQTDSIINNTYYPHFMIGCDVRDRNSACFGSFNSCSEPFSWIGSPVTIENSQWSTVNRYEDTLTFNNAMPLTDTFLQRSDTLYILHLELQDTMTIKGQLDSIAIFSMEVRNSSGILSSNMWHGDSLTLSKTFGLIKFPSWYLFPNYESWFNILDHPLTSDFTFNDVFNYSVGDIFHMRHEWEEGSFNAPTEHKAFYQVNLKQCTVQSVDSVGIENKFEVTCTVEKTLEYFSSNPWEADSTYVSVTVNTVWWTSAELSLFDQDQVKIKTALTDIDGGLEYHTSLFPGGRSGNDCPWHQKQHEPLYDRLTTTRIGIGEIKHSSFELSNFPSGDYHTHDRNLVYFKSEDLEWGEPQWPIGVAEQKTPTQINIWPNPTRDLVNISSENDIKEISIFNSNGVLFKTIQFSNVNSAQVQLKNYAPGVYSLKITTADEFKVMRVMKISD